MPEDLEKELLDLVRELTQNAARKEDLEALGDRVEKLEGTLGNGLRTEVREIADTVESLRQKHQEDDTSIVSLQQRVEGTGKRWALRLNVTPTKGWLTSLALVAFVLLSLGRGSASSLRELVEHLLKSLY